MRKSLNLTMSNFYDRLSLAWLIIAVVYSFWDRHQALFLCGFVLFCNLKAHLYRIEEKISSNNKLNINLYISNH